MNCNGMIEHKYYLLCLVKPKLKMEPLVYDL